VQGGGEVLKTAEALLVAGSPTARTSLTQRPPSWMNNNNFCAIMAMLAARRIVEQLLGGPHPVAVQLLYLLGSHGRLRT